MKNAFELNGISAASRCMVVTRDTLSVETEEYTPQTFSENMGLPITLFILSLKMAPTLRTMF